MPHKVWTHRCGRHKTAVQLGTESCPYCGQVGEYTGWGYSMVEAMGAYQYRTGIKPVGPHRPLADRLFQPYMKKCDHCKGSGLLDVRSGESWAQCPSCGGNCCVFTGTAQEWAALHDQVAGEFPDALVPTSTHPEEM